MDYKPLKPTVEEIINAIHVKEWIEEPEGVAEYPPLSMFNTSHRCPTTGRRHTIACPQMDSPSPGAGDLLSVKSPRHQRKSRNHSPRRHSEKGDGRQPSPRRRTCKDGEDEAYSAVPREYQNPKVQEADGHFFENFTALSWRQENKRLRATAEDNNEKHVFVEGQVALKPQRHKLTKREFELLYIEVLYTIKHKIGQTAGGHSPVVQDLFYYAQEAFKISPEDHARLLAKATEEKPPIVILNIAVIMARDLEAKDADGFSDPYCMLGILPGRREGTEHSISTDEEESPKGKESRSKSFRMSLNKKKKDKEKDREKEKARDAIPARLIKSTGVVNNSLNPVWNERFRFDLEDVNSDKLHLDIWDHDEEFSVFDAAKTLNEVQGLRGLGRYFKQIAQSARACKKSGNVDDFLGCVSIPLNDIPSTGIEKWFPLEGRSSRSNVQGDIKLKLYLATREDRGIDEEDNWTDVRQHEDLITIFIEHEIRKCGKKAIHWNGDLPQAARTILHQHAIQGDVTDAQQAMCMWMAFTKQHMEYLLDYGLLYNLLDTLNQLWTPDSFSREEEELLAESFRNFLRYCLSVLSKQREVFPSANKHCVKRLESMLRCASKIHEMEVFRMICPFEKSLTSEIKHAVQKSTTDFYERIYNIAKTLEESEENVPKFLINLTNNLNIDLIQATTTYNTLYERICKVHYFDIVYKYLDRKLGDEFEHRLRALRKLESRLRESEGNRATFPLGPKIFELYFSLQEFCNFQEYYSKSDHPPAHTSSFYHWFYFVIELWLDIAKQNEERRIKTAIMLDQFAEVSKGAKYSSSAADVCCCFSQMMQFWKQLNLQNSLDIFPLTLKLTQTVCEGAILYADLVYSKIKEEGFFDEEGQFDVSEQLCASINDIEHVRRGLYQLPEALGFAEVKQALESAERGQEYSLDTMVKNADQLMLNKIQYIIDKVTDKMRPDIKKDVFHLNWAPESVPASKAIEDLLAYLDNNLVTMNKNLLKMNFDRTLVALWVEILEEFSDSLLKEEQRQPVHYQRMFDALEILVDFFHANEKGLAVKDIESRQYRDLRNLLSFYRLSTPQLIEAFYEEKLQDQVLLMNTTSKDYGVLNVRMSYRQEGHSLLIEVVNAKDIIPLDANGLSDPFVLLQLCPEHVFPNVPVQKTKVVKKTLNPVFEETFEFAVSVEQCRHPGSTLVFTVMDHDYVFQNDFAGEAFVRLSEIPGVEGESHNYEALHVVSLPLMQPRHKENGALDVLATRTGDRAAQEFVRNRSKTEELAVHKT